MSGLQLPWPQALLSSHQNCSGFGSSMDLIIIDLPLQLRAAPSPNSDQFSANPHQSSQLSELAEAPSSNVQTPFLEPAASGLHSPPFCLASRATSLRHLASPFFSEPPSSSLFALPSSGLIPPHSHLSAVFREERERETALLGLNYNLIPFERDPP